MSGTSAAFGAGQGALSAGLTVAQARAQNRAIENQQRREFDALGFESAAVRRRSANRSEDVRRASAQIESRLRALESFSGGGGVGFDRVRDVNAYETGINLGRIEQEADEQIASLRLTRLGRIRSLESQMQNPVLAGILGGLGGTGSGLALGSQIERLNR